MRRFSVHPAFVALLCLMYYLCSWPAFCAFALLSVLHELGHLSALALLGVPVRSIRVGLLGTVIETEPMGHGAELFCALCGPAVNLLCFWLLRRWRMEAAVLSLGLAVYNLLPVYPLDGGRALRAALSSFLPLRTVDGVECAVHLLLLAAGGAGLWLGRAFGLLPAGGFALLLLHLADARKFLLPSAGQIGIIRKTPKYRGMK